MRIPTTSNGPSSPPSSASTPRPSTGLLKVDAKAQAGARPFEHRLVVRETSFRTSSASEKVGIQDLSAALARDEVRNAMILNDVVRALEEGRSPILLTERKEHLAYFADRLGRVARHLVVLQGGMGAKADRAVRAQLDAIPPNEERLLLATGRYIGEGFDDARLDTAPSDTRVARRRSGTRSRRMIMSSSTMTT